MCKVAEQGNGTFISNGMFHEAYNLTKSCIGIISKPGGGTLIDSFSAETPILFTASVGKHEDYNKQLWEHFGFGAGFDIVKDHADLYSCLHQMSMNMRRHKVHSEDVMQLVNQLINLNPKKAMQPKTNTKFDPETFNRLSATSGIFRNRRKI
jgi:UDP-N-acetylglucosamine:LPS N-acetylglucosamine transferase